MDCPPVFLWFVTPLYIVAWKIEAHTAVASSLNAIIGGSPVIRCTLVTLTFVHMKLLTSFPFKYRILLCWTHGSVARRMNV